MKKIIAISTAQALLILGIAIAILVCIVPRSSTATPSQTIHSVVILHGEKIWYYLDQGVDGPNRYGVSFQGIFVQDWSSSSGAPSFQGPGASSSSPSVYYSLPVTTNSLAQALADLLNQGYRIDHADGYTYTLSR